MIVLLVAMNFLLFILSVALSAHVLAAFSLSIALFVMWLRLLEK